MKILVTGSSGFIGFHVARYLLERGDEVVGVDNLNNYYDVKLKESRLRIIKDYKNYNHYDLSLEDKTSVDRMFNDNTFDRVVHLAAQAGVRYSLEDPHAYISSNVVGFMNILEACRHHQIGHLIYASSSSVYGLNTAIPFSVHHNVAHPVSLYAATKKSNELMAHSYSHLFDLPTTGLRFFTVYGPWGRPDMAYFSFTKAIFSQKTITLFNFGKMRRDFTYIDDAVEIIVRIIDGVAKSNPDWDGASPDPATSKAPYQLFNIGNSSPVELSCLVETIEKIIGRTAGKKYLPMQPGDVLETYADVEPLVSSVGFKPVTSIYDGLKRFIDWYREFYNV